MNARWRGLAQLVTDAVVHGTSAIERVHVGTAARTFDVLEQIPVVAGPAHVVHVVHETATRAVYASIRGVARVVGKGIDVGLVAAKDEVPGDSASPL
jgi:hypothetical protein